MTIQELRQCQPISGAYPVSLLRAYYSAIVGRRLTDADVYDILEYWKPR